MNKNYPVFMFDGPDGTGKTTQALLLCSFLELERNTSVAYCSFPVYEFPIGRAIGRCLGRWGKQDQISLPSPESMAVLFALNRLEALPYLREVLDKNQLLFLNRGPFSNLYSVARQALLDGKRWELMPDEERQTRIFQFFQLDQKFLKTLGNDREIVPLFLLLDIQVSMMLARTRAASTLGGEPDEYERSSELQYLTAKLYREVASGKYSNLPRANLIIAEKGSVRRWRELGHIEEIDGILATSEEVGRVIALHLLGRESVEGFVQHLLLEGLDTATDSWHGAKTEGKIRFDFREKLGLTRGFQPDIEKSFPGILERTRNFFPGAMEAIEASRRIDEGKIKKEREGI